MRPPAIGDHRAPVSLPKLKKAYEKGTRGISWGPLLTPRPRAVPEFPNSLPLIQTLQIMSRSQGTPYKNDIYSSGCVHIFRFFFLQHFYLFYFIF
ncbi:unnamed protein product, partial [Staurois parvus]